MLDDAACMFKTLHHDDNVRNCGKVQAKVETYHHITPTNQSSTSTLLPTFLHNPTPQDPHILHRPIPFPSPHHPKPLHGPHTPLHPPENRMLSIQPRRWRQRHEKLTPVRIRSRIRHRHHTRARVLQGRQMSRVRRRGEFVFEFTTGEDCFAAATGASGVAGLNHEVGDDAVDGSVVVVLATEEGGEVETSFGGVGGVQFEGDRAL